MNQWDLIQLIRFCTAKESLGKTKQNKKTKKKKPMEEQKIALNGVNNKA